MRGIIVGVLFWGLSVKAFRTISSDDGVSSRVHSPNKFLTLRTFCSPDTLTVVAVTENIFTGALYARGYPLECRSVGNESREIRLTMDVRTCGIKVEEKGEGQLEYEVLVHLQYDRVVQQSIDEVASISCIFSDNLAGDVAGKAVPMVVPAIVANNERRGRLYEDQEPGESPRVGRSSADFRLDILRGDDHNAKPVDDFLKVGETVNVAVKVKERVGVESKVIDCIGHDGTEGTFQPLVDENGCSVDDAIMPSFTENGRNGKFKLFQSTFSAFKFPDRDYLHLKCFVLICVNKCPLEDCTNDVRTTDKNTSSNALKNVADTVLNTIEVFNSVRVLAPEIEIDNIQLRGNEMNAKLSGTMYKKDDDDNDDLVCTSPARLIATFGLLSGIFFVAVLISGVSYFWIKLQRRLMTDSESIIYFPYSPSESYS